MKIEEVSAEPITRQQRVLALMSRAYEFRQSGDLAEATQQWELALAEARSTPYEIEFQTRIQLAMSLADLYQALDKVPEACEMLREESQFAERVSQIMGSTGTPSQKRAATSGFLQVRDRATQMALLGSEAPEISIRDWLHGGPASLNELRGSVVLLEFWATWCKPCQEMFPKLKRLHETERSRGLEIIALTRHYMAYGGTAESKMQERQLMLGMVSEHEVDFHVGIAEDEGLQGIYGANGLPTLVLVNRNGIIRYVGPGEGDLVFNTELQKSLETAR